MAMTADLLQLLEHDIPQGRKHLQDSHVNLEKVATYCEGNYLQSRDKRYALDETKNFTTQSLASVAYQINTLASHFLNLIDFQFSQMANMESNINHLSQTVMIHKEKVARREIGVLTTNKTTTRPPGMKTGIIFPEQPERPVKYVRKAIDYNVLDEIGHGVKTASQSQSRPRRPSSSSNNSGRDSMRGAPTTKPPTPPLMYKGSSAGMTGMTATLTSGGTLSRQSSAVSASNSPYRTSAPPVSPPSLPSNYAPNYPQVSQQQYPQVQGDRRSGYASVKNMAPPPNSQAPPPPMGMVYPMMSHSMQGPPATPPPPPMPMDSYQDLPPPPDESAYATHQQVGNVSPPLPPPPDAGGDPHHHHFNLPPPSFEPGYGMHGGRVPGSHRPAPVEDPGPYGTPIPRYARQQSDLADWIPQSYLAKVVAIYDYTKDKDDELSFNEGAVIYVIKKNDDGWYEGVLDGTTGLFPGNYVEELIQR